MRGCLSGPAGKFAKRKVNDFPDFPAGSDSGATQLLLGTLREAQTMRFPIPVDEPLSYSLQGNRQGIALKTIILF